MSTHRLSRVALVALHIVALTVLGAGQARAQGFISPMIGFNFGGDSQCVEITGCEDKNLNVSVGFGAMGNVLGFEEEFAYAKDFFGSAPGFDSSVLTLMSNLMLVPNFGPVRPYGLIGAGLIKSKVDFTTESILSADNNQFGWDVGGGLMIILGDHVGVRGDVRYFHSFQDLDILGVSIGGDKLDFGRASGGVVFKF